MKFRVSNRTITSEPEKIISYAVDYTAEFEFDEEWAGKIITARFVRNNGEYIDVVLEDDQCNIPLFQAGTIYVGCFTDEFTSTYVKMCIDSSIKDLSQLQMIPPTSDAYSQLIRMIESGILKGDPGEPGKDGSDYEITAADYQAIADRVPQPDLSDYVKNTDYASANKGGVIKSGYGLNADNNGIVNCSYARTPQQYENYSNYNFISKGTLENVLNERLAESEWEKVFDAEIDANTSIPISKKFNKIIIAFWCTETEAGASSGGLAFNKNGNTLSYCNLSNVFTLNNHRVYYFENNGGYIFNPHGFIAPTNIFNANWWAMASITSQSIRSILPLDKWEEFDGVGFSHNNQKAFKGRLTVWVR